MDPVAHRFPTTAAQFRYNRLIHRPGKYIKLSVLKSDNQQEDAVIHRMMDGGPAFSAKNFNGSNIMFGEWDDDQGMKSFMDYRLLPISSFDIPWSGILMLLFHLPDFPYISFMFKNPVFPFLII